ncbi:hypothetical protein [Pseudomonas chlororaphis]|uniref:Phage abortive infection protein n=2 Tax=Pseudomonas chlororaphis TaxID=587753 RepID=A0AAX3G6G1_9PSED|nr:hypothetical protein [Pseudomonas chlororaphis]AZC36834.1 hypothetical protein C4K37_2447 [Pseudomonas chlororaphis subsp. piscium]AZC43380.1 hypothetical protein C4K36_2455 [Pseudomonas chlororaphis subsp. piscium]WDG75254.1 hypothetical protein PUP65_13070 [Pseudomonas chlororaphis]WDH27110.1 hypothetical protein PUP81_21240 [Pseudomonas chlororaphis]WDH73774.1 hypothetical protein PUP78_13065 [Pseudomonas chlororaphis]
MNPRFLLIVAGIALSFMAAIVVVYLDMFGINRIHDQAIWGAFGDYFGGILNPIFALFAFLGVLWSLDLQMKQVRQLALDKKADEILQVVKDIDARLAGLLQTNIGETSGFDIHILHMVAEAGRGAKQKGDSNSYKQFLQISAAPGSLVEAAVREIQHQVSTMCEFLQCYPQQQGGGYTPIIEYYASKTSRLIPMLNDLGGLPEPTRAFFDAKIRSA